MYLPPSYRNQLDDGESASVLAFTEGDGIAYGFGLGEEDTARADAMFQEALSAYMRNEFDEAEARKLVQEEP